MIVDEMTVYEVIVDEVNATLYLYVINTVPGESNGGRFINCFINHIIAIFISWDHLIFPN